MLRGIFEREIFFVASLMVKLVLKLDCRLICLLNGDLLGHLASKINILVFIYILYWQHAI